MTDITCLQCRYDTLAWSLAVDALDALWQQIVDIAKATQDDYVLVDEEV